MAAHCVRFYYLPSELTIVVLLLRLLRLQLCMTCTTQLSLIPQYVFR